MPYIKSITLGQCTSNSGSGGSGDVIINRIKDEVQDVAGTGVIYWTKNAGVLPTDLGNMFDVESQGIQLKYPEQYTVTPFATPTTARIDILNPFPGAFYTMTAYYYG
jgi:hypothetical protein